jgi:hypothetical protein
MGLDRSVTTDIAERESTVDATDIPARLDRLPWSRFHWRVTAALGVTWALDGLEVTLAETFAGALQGSPLELDPRLCLGRRRRGHLQG